MCANTILFDSGGAPYQEQTLCSIPETSITSDLQYKLKTQLPSVSRQSTRGISHNTGDSQRKNSDRCSPTSLLLQALINCHQPADQRVLRAGLGIPQKGDAREALNLDRRGRGEKSKKAASKAAPRAVDHKPQSTKAAARRRAAPKQRRTRSKRARRHLKFDSDTPYSSGDSASKTSSSK